MKAAEWIDRLKAKHGWESDYRVAKELGVSRNNISNYRIKPDATMDDDTAVRVAELLEEQPEIIIIDQVTERTKSEPARAALGRVLERLSGKGGGGGKGRVDITSVALAVAVGAAALFAPAPSQAQPVPCERGIHIVSNRPRRNGRGVIARMAELLRMQPMHAPA